MLLFLQEKGTGPGNMETRVADARVRFMHAVIAYELASPRAPTADRSMGS